MELITNIHTSITELCSAVTSKSGDTITSLHPRQREVTSHRIRGDIRNLFCAQVEELELQINLLDEVAVTLKRTLISIQAERAALLLAMAPISCLPVEILCAVFRWSVFSKGLSPPHLKLTKDGRDPSTGQRQYLRMNPVDTAVAISQVCSL